MGMMSWRRDITIRKRRSYPPGVQTPPMPFPSPAITRTTGTRETMVSGITSTMTSSRRGSIMLTRLMTMRRQKKRKNKNGLRRRKEKQRKPKELKKKGERRRLVERLRKRHVRKKKRLKKLPKRQLRQQ